jgi:RecA/RadA recombinase
MIEEVKLEKIETTYGDFFKMTKENPDDVYYVETYKGEFTPIYAAAEKEVNQMYAIEFDDGYKIECADEHVLMDKAGDELYVKDIVKNKRVMSKYGTKTVKSIRKTNSKVAYDINIDAPHWYVNDENGLIHHNTLLGLVCMKAYLDKHPNGIAILYDSEFGITPAYLKSLGIPTDRVLHIPILNIEELKFDMTQRLKELKKSDEVYILIDSLGNLASLKEATDAEDGKSVQDMSRAKQIKSFFRIITPHFTLKDIPCVVINHVYDGQGLFAKKVVSGGQGVMLSANQVFIISKAQEKQGDEIAGWKFTINIEKSRFVKEKSRIPFTVLYEGGIQKWSYLFDLAVESGHIVKTKVGWYAYVDQETGEILEPNRREKSVKEDNEFFEALVKDESFKDFVRKKFQISDIESNPTLEDIDIDA